MDEAVTVYDLDPVTRVERPDAGTLIVEGVANGRVYTMPFTEEDAPWGYMKLPPPFLDNLEREMRGRMESSQKD